MAPQNGDPTPAIAPVLIMEFVLGVLVQRLAAVERKVQRIIVEERILKAATHKHALALVAHLMVKSLRVNLRIIFAELIATFLTALLYRILVVPNV
jgi:hypothetical protein